jgi:hypothetical protein
MSRTASSKGNSTTEIGKAYVEAKRKARWIKQFKCCNPERKKERRWWGPAQNSQCLRCRKTGTIVPFEEMIGVGWFHCPSPCGRLFAGFCKGEVQSKCHKCNTRLTAQFIVPGTGAGSKKEHTHHCEVCLGVAPCPIVEMCHGVE